MSRSRRGSLRKPQFALALFALMVGSAVAGCGTPQLQGGLGPLPEVPFPADNPKSDAKIELGRLLFFDQRMSGDGSTSCTICHSPEL